MDKRTNEETNAEKKKTHVFFGGAEDCFGGVEVVLHGADIVAVLSVEPAGVGQIRFDCLQLLRGFRHFLRVSVDVVGVAALRRRQLGFQLLHLLVRLTKLFAR